MSTLTIIITAATFFLIGAGLGHLFARQNKTGDQSVQDLEKTGPVRAPTQALSAGSDRSLFKSITLNH